MVLYVFINRAFNSIINTKNIMIENQFYIPKSKVFHFIPWNSNKNIGKSYNEMMSLIDDDDWACFLDGDAVHTTSFFGKRIEDVIESNPEYTLFTSYTNRIGQPYQLAPKINQETNDQRYHREVGDVLWNQNKTKVIDITNNQPLSGVVILIKKSSWVKVGGFKEDKMLGVDNDIHYKFQRQKMKIGLMSGIYVQHWYRGGNKKDISHLI